MEKKWREPEFLNYIIEICMPNTYRGLATNILGVFVIAANLPWLIHFYIILFSLQKN